MLGLYLLDTFIFWLHMYFFGVFFCNTSQIHLLTPMIIYLFICLQLFCSHYVTLNVENVLTVSLQGLSTLVVKEVFHYMLKHSNSKSIPIPKLNNPITIWDIT